jgi:hypothetical protein
MLSPQFGGSPHTPTPFRKEQVLQTQARGCFAYNTLGREGLGGDYRQCHVCVNARKRQVCTLSAYLFLSNIETCIMTEYSLSDVLERMYQNQLALEAALMELVLQVEAQGHAELGDNVRGALYTIGENAGHIKQGLARLKKLP